MEAQGRTNAKRYIEYTAKRYEFDVATQTSGAIGEKQPKINGGIFFFEKHPLYISSAKSTTPNSEKLKVISFGMAQGGSVAISGDTLSVYSLDTSGTLLERFIEAVSASRTTDVDVTAANTMAPPGDGSYRYDLWNSRVRPQRPFSTIDLDTTIKNSLLADVDKFFSPGRLEWYARLGLSCKRGILLSGPPGTGKSSIALALAGHIGGPLFNIVIGQVPDEKTLTSLFDEVSEQSVLLLEDIDSAGIVRENVTFENAARDDESDDDNGGYDRKPSKGKSKISLSGLLNAIDALAEGSILVMTTNNAEALDKALIRPGRIDKQVRVGCASQAVAASIFKRFYNADSDDSTDEVARISELAVQFSEKIPNLKFTPAEIQGYLIPRSDDPDEAIAGLEQFVADLSAAKAAGKNIIGEDSD